MYLFYLNGVQLPIAPSKLQTKIKNQNKTVNLINNGEVNLLREPGLTEISFTALLPNARPLLNTGSLTGASLPLDRKYPFASYPEGFKDSAYYLNLLEELKGNAQAFSFEVIRNSPEGAELYPSYNFLVSLESYEIIEDAKNGVDFEVSIQLKQFRDYSTKIYNFTVDNYENAVLAAVTEERPVDKPIESSYIVKDGDSLWSIAKLKLGSGAKSGLIYELNKAVIEEAAKKNGKLSSSNGHFIYTGTGLQLTSNK